MGLFARGVGCGRMGGGIGELKRSGPAIRMNSDNSHFSRTNTFFFRPRGDSRDSQVTEIATQHMHTFDGVATAVAVFIQQQMRHWKANTIREPHDWCHIASRGQFHEALGINTRLLNSVSTVENVCNTGPVFYASATAPQGLMYIISFLIWEGWITTPRGQKKNSARILEQRHSYS